MFIIFNDRNIPKGMKMLNCMKNNETEINYL